MGHEFFPYVDQSGEQIHVLASKTAEKDFLRSLASHLIKPPSDGEEVSQFHILRSRKE